jgi:hypothetical protein
MRRVDGRGRVDARGALGEDRRSARLSDRRYGMGNACFVLCDFTVFILVAVKELARLVANARPSVRGAFLLRPDSYY